MRAPRSKVNTVAYGAWVTGDHMTQRSATESRLDRDAWLERSLEVLRDEGIVGVRVERLARDLGVTKGSFYWHFDGREDLFASLLEFWAQQYNDVVVNEPSFMNDDPATALLDVMIMVRAQGLDRYELAMRSWADHDERARTAVREVYRKRRSFIRSFFKRLGFDTSDAEIRTRLLLCCLSWEPNMYLDESKSRRLDVLKQQHQLLVQK